ncbi:hypothetical protein [Pseudomonas saliphila]|uniref:hypothetical protein n=1 Tax=Pseudomonas saliphila TaxID=2586906 RepID=UPI0012397DE5
MTMMLLASFALIVAFGLSLACGVMDEAHIEQAALIPFADDPDAAEQLTRETGRRCETVVCPVQEPFADQSSVAYLDA